MNFGHARRSRRVLVPTLVVMAVALAGVLRIVHLTDRSLWFDEAFSWRLIQFPFLEFLLRAAADVHPILYYFLLRMWIIPQALLELPVTLFTLRFPSVLLALVTVISMYVAGATIFRSRFIGVVAAWVTAVNAFQIQYAWEARMYTLGTALLPFALADVIRATRALTPSRRRWLTMRAGLFLGLLLHVHYYALFSVAAVAVYGVVNTARHFARRGFEPLVAVAIAVLVFAPQLPTFLEQRSRVTAGYWIPPMHVWSIPITLARLFLGSVSEPAHALALMFTVAIVGVCLLALVIGRMRGDLLLVLSFFVPFGASVLTSLSTSVYQDRYFVFAALPLFLILGRSLSFLPNRWRAASAMIIVCLGVLQVFSLWRALDFPNHRGTAAAAAYLAMHAQPREPIVVSSSFIYFPLAFHLQSGIRYGFVARADAVNIPSTATPLLYTENEFLNHFSGGPILTPDDVAGPEVFQTMENRLWVVDTTGFGGSRLKVPPAFALVQESSFAELFLYQGEIIVREYARW